MVKENGMKSRRLFLSFWDITLENLPEGNFRRRRLSPAEAKSCILEARRKKELVCVVDKDLLAPYRQIERSQQEELCAVLTKHYGIPLTLRHFLDRFEHEGKRTYTVMPQIVAQVQHDNRLLVVTCRFALKSNLKELWRTKRRLGEADPATVEFHLFEAVAPVKKSAAKRKTRAQAKKSR
jgi:hypothetical protein